jgi:hypothetical protein
MNRCVWLASVAAVTLVTWAEPAAAQLRRNFPASALRGDFVVVAPPEILLNGSPARLAPGARIRGADNMLVLSGAIVQQRLLVHYTLDTLGLVREVWVLTPAEAAKFPWPVTLEQAGTWTFDPDSQTWSLP